VQAQRDLSLSLEKIGDVKLKAGDRDGALAAYDESFAIARTLAEADPASAQAQRNLSVSLERIGDVKLKAGDRDGALAAYNESFAIARMLAEADPTSAQAQRNLSVSLGRIANVKLQTSDRAGAFAAEEERLAIRRKLAEADPDNAEAQRDLVNALGGFAFAAVIVGEFTQAESVSREGIALAPDQTWLQTNLAHALMLEDKPAEADAIYLGNRGRMLNDKTWEQAILEDFTALREAGIDHPHMAEVEAAFKNQATKD
jgi:tetratricopeptide (TPR) repeat protein